MNASMVNLPVHLQGVRMLQPLEEIRLLSTSYHPSSSTNHLPTGVAILIHVSRICYRQARFFTHISLFDCMWKKAEDAWRRGLVAEIEGSTSIVQSVL